MKKILSFAAAVLCTVAMSAQDVRVLSFNLGSDEGGHNWENRSVDIAAMLQKQAPDVIGLQECSASRRKSLEKQLGGYSAVELSKKGASDNLIFYCKETADVLSSGSFSLGDKPDRPISRFSCGEQDCNAVWAVFRLKNGREVLFVNTTFDAKSKEARVLQAELVLEQAGKLSGGRPVVVTGTLNCKPSPWNDKTRAPGFIFKSAGLLDARQMAIGTDSKPSFTAWGAESKMTDYIFYSVVGLSAIQFRTIEGEQPLSDHNPIRANLKFK